jgi:hypothetical protein
MACHRFRFQFSLNDDNCLFSDPFEKDCGDESPDRKGCFAVGHVCVTIKKARLTGAQSERPGAARPVSGMFGDSSSPAAFSCYFYFFNFPV